jgi:hypothetical protein
MKPLTMLLLAIIAILWLTVVVTSERIGRDTKEIKEMRKINDSLYQDSKWKDRIISIERAKNE